MWNSTVASIFILLFTVSLQALNPATQMLVDMETRANAAAKRSNAPVVIEHYEVPLRLLNMKASKFLSTSSYKSLVFTKNGESFVRWIINPEDTQWHKDVESLLIKNNLPANKQSYFKGYKTASRSYILEDPKTGHQFSLKASTNRTGGLWKDKKQEYKDGFDIAMISDLFERLEKQKPFQNFKIMFEPLVFGIQSIDQSLVVRELAGLARSKNKYYVPGFSVLHEEVGASLARHNGSLDPATFWEKHYVTPMARASAEFTFRSGIWLDSPHSQNFLIELDENLKPTGKIVIRDLGDVYLFSEILTALEETDLLKKFSEPHNIVKNHVDVSFGPLHGNTPPDWVTHSIYTQWSETYAQTYLETVQHLTQNKDATLKLNLSTTPMSYMQGKIPIHEPQWQFYPKAIRPAAKWCSSLFD